MFANPLSLVLSSTGMIVSLLIPIGILLLVTTLLLASLHKSSGTVHGTARAIYAYLAQSLGIFLVSFAAIPTLFSVLSGQSFLGQTYMAFLFVFGFGGIVFLWHENMLRLVDASSRLVPSAIFHASWKVLGLLALLFGGLSLSLQLLLAQRTLLTNNWWAMDTSIILWGIVVLWACSTSPITGSSFQSTPMRMKKKK